MKILVITNLYPPHHVGGYELRCEAVVNLLRQRGHTIQVLTSDHGLTGPKSEAGVQRSLRIHGFFGHPWLPIRKLVALELHNNQTVLQAIHPFNPDVIHVWNLGGISKSICLTLQNQNIPLVYDVSDHWIARSLAADVWLDWWNRSDPSPQARLLRTFWTLCGMQKQWREVAPIDPISRVQFQRLYFCSRALRDLTVSKGFNVGHGQIIYCPVNTTRFTGEPQPEIKPLRKLLYVGRLSEDKGVMTALKAMQQAGKDLELQVYGRGDDDYTHKLHDFVTEHSLQVTFHSATPEQMPAVYRNHDALLFTSEWEEPFALTPLEAMSCGLPVIGTLTGGSRELLRNNENALTYDAGNEAQLAQCISTLSKNPGLRCRIANQGFQEVRSQYSEPVIVSRIEQYLEETRAQWSHPATSPAAK